MKIAITADLHLTSRSQNPERFETLENLITDLYANGIDTLLIAGDLFDTMRQNYAEFEQICRNAAQRKIEFYIIPGNHDPAINSRKIVADNVRIFVQPTLIDIDGRSFLFVPYQNAQSMGEVLMPLADQLRPDEWVLIGHGDWAAGLRTPNPAEPGIYMPLTRRDVEVLQPTKVFLGHIHEAMDAPPVHYVGSPCGLDITETGRRRYLVYDTVSDEVEACEVTTPILFYDESFIIMPADDEASYLRQQIESRQQAWGLAPQERAKALLRVKVRGYSADRSALQDLLQESFAGYAFYNGQRPNIDDVYSSDDVERQYIVEQVRDSLEGLVRSDGPDEPGNDDILLKAMQIIYGG